MDGSGSIHEENFKKVLEFLSKIVAKLTIGANDTQVGMLQFSENYTLEFPLQKHQNKDELIKAILNVPYRTGGTLAGNAIDHVAREGFLKEKVRITKFYDIRQRIINSVILIIFILSTLSSVNFQI